MDILETNNPFKVPIIISITTVKSLKVTWTVKILLFFCIKKLCNYQLSLSYDIILLTLSFITPIKILDILWFLVNTYTDQMYLKRIYLTRVQAVSNKVSNAFNVFDLFLFAGLIKNLLF